MLAKPFIAAGLFDSPWVVVVIVIAGALVNWLSKRRAEKSLDQPPADQKSNSPPPTATDWETRLRRMLGEEETTASPALPPPPLRRPPPGNPAPASGRLQPPGIRPATRPPAPALRPPSVEVAPVLMAEAAGETPQGVERAIRRYEQLGESRVTPARAKGQTRSGRGSALGTSLHHPQTARQAFAASLVFGPPKALEVER